MSFRGRTRGLHNWPGDRREKDFPGGSVGEESACSAGDVGSIPGSERSPGGGNGNPLQYPCLENPLDGGASWGHMGSPWGPWGHRESDTTEPEV